ncbi:MAG: flagellar biosynthesis protein FlgC [Alphaproteobacteria bacterium]|nr:flagellar biosynthesis protein FlgC [Alphaproteobacteria bacterium]
MDPINSALSGMNAAATRVAVSANNVANSQSTAVTGQDGQGAKTPFVPQQVVQQSLSSGGVGASLKDVSPPSIPVFAPDNPAAGDDGIVNLPNVNLATETANQLLAANSYKANANVMKRADEMYKSLLDIQS